VNATSSYSCVGDTQALMDAVFKSHTGIEASNVISGKTVSIGAFKGLDFYEALNLTCKNILSIMKKKDFSNTLLLVGSSVGGMPVSEEHFFKDKSYKNIKVHEHTIHSIALYLKDKYSFLGARSYSTACTSSSNALMMAKRLIEIGAYSDILVIGADALCKTTIFGFDALSILSSKQCKPFDIDRDGMNVAEGIGALFLQNTKTQDSVEFLGAAGSSDAYHITNPDPSCTASLIAMEKSLADAQIKVEEIDYINAHGTGTKANDSAEATAIEKLFLHKPPVSSTKGVTGHTLGAAGAIEALICVEAIRAEQLPINVNCTTIESELNIVLKASKKKIKFAMSNSFAFGGNNTSLIFGSLS